MNTQEQLTLEGFERVVNRALDRKLSEPRTLRDPKRNLEAYPTNMHPDQVAAFLNCSARHVRDLVDEGKLAAVNIAPGSQRRELRITRDSVAAFHLNNSTAN